MQSGFKEIGGPINKKIVEIETKYNEDLAELEMTRDKARNSFFKLPKKSRDTSEEGLNEKRIYLDAAYKIVILENQKNLDIAKLQIERYKKGRLVRLENI